MIIVDANLLIYANVNSMPQHSAARRWLNEKLNGQTKVGLAWSSVLAFLRLVTNPRLFEQPISVTQAWQQVETWLEIPVVWIPQPTDRHREVLGQLIRIEGMRANLFPDAHLAALAIEHGLVLCSADKHFGRFPGLRWENPLD